MSSIHIFSTWASAWILYIIRWSKQSIPHLKRLVWSSLRRPFSSSFSLGRLISSSFSYWYSLTIMLTHYHYHWAGFSIYILIMEASYVLIVTLDSCQLFLSLVSWKKKLLAHLYHRPVTAVLLYIHEPWVTHIPSLVQYIFGIPRVSTFPRVALQTHCDPN